MSKPKVNSGHGRHAKTTTVAPTKPSSATRVASGFLPLESGNASGVRAIPKRNLPSGNPSTGTNSGYEWRNQLAGVGKRGKRMY